MVMELRIVLLNTPNLNIKNSVKDLLYGCWCQGKRIGGGTFPPLNIISIATLLENENYIKVLSPELYNLNYKDLISYLALFDVIIFPTTSFCYNDDINLLKEVRKINKNIISIVFGAYPTFFPRESVSSNQINYAVVGEPESTIPILVKALDFKNTKSDIARIKGISLKKENKFVYTGKAPFIENLDDLPIPNRDYIKDIYFFNPLVINKQWTTALTSRGCKGTCNFCLSPLFYGNIYRFQSPSYMIKELEYLLEKGYKEVFYRDETFTGNRKRTENFCRLILKKKLDIDWICNVRVGTVNRNTLNLMKLSGCHLIKIGVESGSQKILNNLRKNITLESTRKLFNWAKELKVKTHSHVILGTIGETKSTIKETINFVKKIKPTTVTFNLFTPFPGTTIYKEIIGKFDTELNETNMNFEKVLISPYLSKYYTNLDPSYLENLIPWAYKKFYLRLRYILSLLKEMKSFFSLKNVLKGGLNVISFMFESDNNKSLQDFLA